MWIHLWHLESLRPCTDILYFVLWIEFGHESGHLLWCYPAQSCSLQARFSQKFLTCSLQSIGIKIGERAPLLEWKYGGCLDFRLIPKFENESSVCPDFRTGKTQKWESGEIIQDSDFIALSLWRGGLEIPPKHWRNTYIYNYNYFIYE